MNRVADVKEDALEALYEKRLKKKALQMEQEDNKLQVDPVDVLPVKTLDGKLYYRTGTLLHISLYCLVFSLCNPLGLSGELVNDLYLYTALSSEFV